MIRRLWKRWGPNPLDLLLKRAKKRGELRFLICWNRGLGDIALGLYGLVARIRQEIPEAKITFLTREDLKEGFQLLENVDLLTHSSLKRKVAFKPLSVLKDLHIDPSSFDRILKKPDPTHWLKNEIGVLTPRLKWQKEWDALSNRFSLLDGKGPCIAVHVQTETAYGYEKNWPLSYWEKLFKSLSQNKNCRIILFGHAQTPIFSMSHVIDLRGKTSLIEMLSLIKNCCTHLIVPDSGVLSLTYYLDVSFPLRIVSLWADPRQGVLKQRVPSPNPELQHIPLLSSEEKIANISVDQVLEALFPKCEAQ